MAEPAMIPMPRTFEIASFMHSVAVGSMSRMRVL